MLTLPNYQIGSQIYESLNSLVYRGHQDNQPVILKMLKQDYLKLKGPGSNCFLNITICIKIEH